MVNKLDKSSVYIPSTDLEKNIELLLMQPKYQLVADIFGKNKQSNLEFRKFFISGIKTLQQDMISNPHISNKTELHRVGSHNVMKLCGALCLHFSRYPDIEEAWSKRYKSNGVQILKKAIQEFISNELKPH